jgi:hypothetical protein
MAQCSLGQPFGGTFTCGARNGLKRTDRLAKLWQPDEGLLIDPYVRARMAEDVA